MHLSDFSILAYQGVDSLLHFVTAKVQVNAVIYGSILKGFSRKKRMDRVWDAFNEMKIHGISAFVGSFRT